MRGVTAQQVEPPVVVATVTCQTPKQPAKRHATAYLPHGVTMQVPVEECAHHDLPSGHTADQWAATAVGSAMLQLRQ